MREGETLFFAPGVPFEKLELDTADLANQIGARVQGYYLVPAFECILNRHAFAGGVLLLSAVDFLASLHSDVETVERRPVGREFRAFVQLRLPSFSSGDRAQILYDRFRNGLLHEGRAKQGGEFSFEWDLALRQGEDRAVVNPKVLYEEVEAALTAEVQDLYVDGERRARIASRFRRQFAVELRIVELERAMFRRSA